MMNRFAIFAATLLMVFAAPAMSYADDGKETKKDITRIVKMYEGKSGVNVVNMGALGLTMVKSVLRMGVPKENKTELDLVLKALDGVKKMVMLEYSAAPADLRKQIEGEVAEFFKDKEPLMDVTGGGEKIIVYGIVDEATLSVNDMLLNLPARNTLICLFGSISAQELL